MEILQFSKERGIFAIFNGYGKQAYIFHSSFYGPVGYANIMDDVGSDEITVHVYLGEYCRYWYWSLKDIVTRGIRKAENRYINKKINFIYHYLNRKDTSGVTDNVFKYDNTIKVSLYDDIVEC
jgi:hypothetical protein